MRLAVMHNSDIHKDLTNVRIHYAAESALELAAFRMALISNPLRVTPGGTITAADANTINNVNPTFPTGNHAVWFLNANGRASSTTITMSKASGGGTWYPLTAAERIDNSISPAIRTTVEVRQLTDTEIKKIDGTTSYTQTGSTGPIKLTVTQIEKLAALLGSVSNKEFTIMQCGNGVKLADNGADGVTIRITSVTHTKSDGRTNFVFPSPAGTYLKPGASPKTFEASDLNGNAFYVGGQAQHNFPHFIRAILAKLIEQIIEQEKIVSTSGNAQYYRITSTAELETPNPAFPNKTLEFNYVVTENKETTIELDAAQLNDACFNQQSFTNIDKKTNSAIFNVSMLDLMKDAQLKSTPKETATAIDYTNYFRSRK